MRQVAKYYAILGKQTFTPLDLSPALWLDASDATTITASSGAVSQWRDKSGNARHVSQATAAAQPTTGTATLNGRNVLSFDGGDTLTSSVWSLAQPMTVVTVFRTGASQAVYAFIFDGHNANSGVRAVQVVRNQDFSNQSVVYAGADVVTGVLSSNTAFAWATVFNGASSVSRRDGTTTNLATSPGTAGITSGVAISGTGTNSRFTGTVAEVIIVGSALTAQQLTDLSTYITNKWGVTL